MLPCNANHRQARRLWCRLRQRWTVAPWSNVFSDEWKFVLGFHNGRQRVWRRTRERWQPPALIAKTAVEVGVSWFGEGSPWPRGQNFTSARAMSLGCTTETISLSLSLCPTPVGNRMHSPLNTTMQEPIVHVLSEITCSFAESRLFHGHRSTQTSLQLNLNLWDILWRLVRRRPPGHRISSSSLMHFRRNGAGCPKQ